MAERNEKKNICFYQTASPALLSGAAQAIIFNPFDRALYVRVKFRRKHFLDRRNFHHPFQGFMNAAVYRTLVGASYVFWQDFVQKIIEKTAPDKLQLSRCPALTAFIIGMLAGSLNGAALNGMQVVKYRMWNMENNANFFKVALQAYRESGVSIFFRGIGITILRDCVFGVVYELFRRTNFLRGIFHSYVRPAERRVLFPLKLTSKNNSTSAGEKILVDNKHAVSDNVPCRCCRDELCTCAFISNLVAAMLASVMSSPFNYFRIIVYSTPSGTAPVGALLLFRFFIYQVQFIYKCGESFTDANTAMYGAELKTPCGNNNNNNNNNYNNDSIISSAGITTSSNNCGGKSCFNFSLTRMCRPQVLDKLTATAVCRNRHPMATLRWINARLNVGWGSVRVGLGMAVGQAIFYKLQSVFKDQ